MLQLVGWLHHTAEWGFACASAWVQASWLAGSRMCPRYHAGAMPPGQVWLMRQSSTRTHKPVLRLGAPDRLCGDGSGGCWCVMVTIC